MIARKRGTFLIAAMGALALAGIAAMQASAAARAEIALNPDKTYQTIRGWEATSQSGQDDCQGFERYRDTLFDLAIDDLGINRIRVEIRSGVENPVDYYALLQASTIDYATYKAHRYEIINDNSDPARVDPRGYQFSALDSAFDLIVLPLKRRLEARGEQLFININYVDFGESAFEHKASPAEYAELVLATYQHLQARYGFVPDAWEVVLEPNNAGWSGTQIGRAIVAAADRLSQNRFEPAFIAPSDSNLPEAIVDFDQIAAVPGATAFMREISYHRYGTTTAKDLAALAERAARYRLDTAMLEHIGSGYEDLHQDLKLGRASAWQQYTLAYCAAEDNGGHYFRIDDRDPRRPQVIPGARTQFLRQYFKYIRPGAIRLEATSTLPAIDPLAFANADGRYVVVVKSSGARMLAVRGLPAGTYGISYTTGRAHGVELPAVRLEAGAPLITRIPARGVLTIYTKPTAAR